MLVFACTGGGAGDSRWIADAGAEVGAPDTGRGRGADGGGDLEPRGPEYDDDGWLRIDVDPERACASYTAMRPDQMPPAIEWEPCSEPLRAVYPSCRKMKTDGPFNARLNGFVVAGTSGMVDASGKAVLAFLRHSGNVTHHLVADADGSVRHAIHDGGGACRLDVPRLAAGKVLYPATYDDEDRRSPVRHGAIGGRFDEAAVVLESLVDEYRSYSAGPDAFLDGAAFRAWGPNAPVTAELGEKAHYLDPGIFIGDAFFFRSNASMVGEDNRVRLYQRSSGVRDFLWYGDDVASAAANFGTDGKDMVWVEAFGRVYVGDTWSAIDLVTAPYTTDERSIAKRRLRSLDALQPSPFFVGCGHAAQRHLIWQHPTITRLSDGWFAELELVRGDDAGWLARFTATLAITCDELFVNLDSPSNEQTIARIRLEDLPFASPPAGDR